MSLNDIYRKQYEKTIENNEILTIQSLIKDLKQINKSREKHSQSLWSSGRIKYDSSKREDVSIRLTQRRFDLLFNIVEKQQKLIHQLIKKK